MATQLFANNVITTLAADIDDSQTSLQAAAATGFPAPAAGNWFMIAIFSATTGALLEIVKCTDVTGVTCTIARAQEGTTGTAATAGDILVISPPTKGTFEQLQTDIAANADQIADRAASLANMNLNPKNTLVEYKSATVVTVKGSNVIPLELNGKWWVLDTDFDLDLNANLDTGTKAHGTDYYVYLCDNAGTLTGLLSAATTYPLGYTAATSRKIGGFHYGRVRLVNANWIPLDSVNGAYGAGWEDDVSSAILSNSVWDLKNRPACSPEGMAKVGNIWVDIYQASQDATISLSSGKLSAGTTKSVYNAFPLTGTEGLNWYHFNELAKRTGKRMMSLSEWLMAAEGSPQGNDADNVNAWTATTNPARNPTGTVARAVSAYNICDCVGNVYEWLDEFLHDPTAANLAWYNKMSGQGVGQLYMYNDLGLHAILAGGRWSDGVQAGSRCVFLANYSWIVAATNGCRFACDSL